MVNSCRSKIIIPLIFLTLVGGPLAGISFAASSSLAQVADSGTVFHVQVGSEDLRIGLETEQYFPKNLTVNEGDTVVFTLATNEPHTITFNPPQPIPEPFLPQPDGTLLFNPVVNLPSPEPSTPTPPGTLVDLSVDFDGTGLVNSGFLQNVGDTLRVTFTKAGTYPYICMVHPEDMKGIITVNPAGTAYPLSPDEIEEQAADQILAQWARGIRFLRTINVPPPTTAADGTRTFTVITGASDNNSPNMVLRFIGGENLHIRAGDRISWTMEKNEPGTPHTVTFLSGGPEPDLVTVIPQTSGPPEVILNPQVQNASPSTPAPYAGIGYYNSGLMLAAGPTPQAYTLTFSKPGTYQYICVFHDPAGMIGKIFVSP